MVPRSAGREGRVEPRSRNVARTQCARHAVDADEITWPAGLGSTRPPNVFEPSGCARCHRTARDGYALVFVEPAPLPPHERRWRHPSEFGPSADEIAFDQRVARSNVRVVTIATGALTAALVATLVVTLTPRRPPAPTAMSATTLPAASVVVQGDGIAALSQASDRRVAEVRVDRRSLAPSTPIALTGAPLSVAATPLSQPSDDADVADVPPDGAAIVIVLTSTHAYQVSWDEVDLVDAPDGSVVVTTDGELVAAFDGGELHVLVER